MRKLIIVCGIFLGLTACLSDLRTKTLKEGNLQVDKGRELLVKAGETHHIKKWKDISTYSVIFEDQFHGLIGKIASPFKENPVKLQLDYVPSTFEGRLRFLEGKQKENIWGIQHWKTYTREHERADAIFKKDKKAQFWVPTYQYFIEFPARIQEATAVSYAGEDTFEGEEYHLVLASWNTIEPQKKIDQYIIWIHKKTHQIGLVQYTIREMFSSAKGVVFFKEMRELNGLLIPFYMPIRSKIENENPLHEMKIRDFKVNEVEMKELLPIEK